MGWRFHVTGESLDARKYDVDGEAGPFANPTLPSIGADTSSINGATSIKMSAGFINQGIIYPGRKNVTETSKDLSVLIRFKPAQLATNNALFFVGNAKGNNNPGPAIYATIDTAGNLNAYFWNEQILRGLNKVSFGTGFSTTDWNDLLMTWTNSSSTMEFFLNETSMGTQVSTRKFESNFSYKVFSQIMIGSNPLSGGTQIDVDEFAISDSIESATGLTGPTRTSYLSIAATVAPSPGGDTTSKNTINNSSFGI